MAKHRKTNYEKLHSTGTVADELAKTANKFHKQLNPKHTIRWGKGD